MVIVLTYTTRANLSQLEPIMLVSGSLGSIVVRFIATKRRVSRFRSDGRQRTCRKSRLCLAAKTEFRCLKFANRLWRSKLAEKPPPVDCVVPVFRPQRNALTDMWHCDWAGLKATHRPPTRALTLPAAGVVSYAVFSRVPGPARNRAGGPRYRSAADARYAAAGLPSSLSTD